MNNPNLAQCPDYATAEHLPLCAIMMNGGSTNDQAIELLKGLWAVGNIKDRATWQHQVDDDTAVAADPQQQQEVTEVARAAEFCQEQEAYYKDERKRNKDKYIPIPIDRDVPMQPHNIPATYATRKLNKGHYVELWYFTNDGFDSARRMNTAGDEAALVMIQNEDGSTSWQSVVQPAKGVVNDEDLTFEDFCNACPLFIKGLEDASWPEDRVDMLAGLWSSIQTHLWRRSRDPLERQALLVYAAEQRHLWHAAISALGGGI